MPAAHSQTSTHRLTSCTFAHVAVADLKDTEWMTVARVDGTITCLFVQLILDLRALGDLNNLQQVQPVLTGSTQRILVLAQSNVPR